MSIIKPDIFLEKEKEDFYAYAHDTTIKQEIPQEESKLSLDDFKKHIHEYSKNFTVDELKLYSFAKLSANTAFNKRDSRHYLHLFSTFFMASMKKTFPDKDFTELEKSLENNTILLDESLKDGNIDNDLYIPCILGTMQGLI